MPTCFLCHPERYFFKVFRRRGGMKMFSFPVFWVKGTLWGREDFSAFWSELEKIQLFWSLKPGKKEKWKEMEQ